jgi:5-methylcytosine-specific restriction endonuclease McrA
MGSKKRRKEKRKQEQKSKSLLEQQNAEISDISMIVNEAESSCNNTEEKEAIGNNLDELKGITPKRVSIPKQLRFEVFKRDKFTCQYCGRSAPDVVLNIDHIKPVAEFGTNDILNLITSCFDCNSGKRDKLLSDDTIIKRQQSQLEALQERKEQIEMMFEWKKGLLEIDDQITNQLADYWSELVTGYSLNDNGRTGLKKLSRKFQLDEIMTAMKIASEQYLVLENGEYKKESVENAWSKTPGICYNRKLERENPDLARLYYIRKIMQYNFRYVNDIDAINLLKKAYKLGATLESLEDHVRSSNNWNEWSNGIEEFIEKNNVDSGKF